MSATENEPSAIETLRTRLAILEAALACVREECETAHVEPMIAMTTIFRIDAVSRQALTGVSTWGCHAASESPQSPEASAR